MTQTLWQRKPKRMRIVGERRAARAPCASAKDLALYVIATIGTNGAQGHAARICRLRDLRRWAWKEGRLTLCNMSIEAGARCALVATG